MASLRTLDHRLVPAASALFRLARRADPRFVVTSARRSTFEQARLFERFQGGLSNLPAAAPGTSMHEVGLAFDIARLGIPARQDPLLRQLGAVWNRMGGKWNAVDPVHFSV